LPRNRFDRVVGRDFLGQVPKAPGIYRVWNLEGQIIYVGKAKDLRRRLSQYRNAKRCKKHRRMRGIVAEAKRIEWQVTSTHLEACLLEIRCIQESRPRWNIAGAFAFRYPFVGLAETGNRSLFCFSQIDEPVSGFEMFGVYRSRFLTMQAFYSLMELLKFLGHSETKSWRKANPPSKGTYPFAFRRLPENLGSSRWRAFLLGESDEVLETLSLRLLEHAAARAKAGDVEEGLKNLKKFWEREALPLRRAIEATRFSEYPVRQSERDLLFLRYRVPDTEASCS